MEKKLNSVQLAELELAKKIKIICDENNLNFFMLGGAMLGAIRHGGFIPWDDDMDFGLMRNDYEKLYEVLSKEKKLKIVSYKTKTTHDYPFKVIDTTQKITINNYKDKDADSYAWIDIFPIDGMPNIKVARQFHKTVLLMDRALMKLSQLTNGVALNNPNRTMVEKIIIFGGYLIRVDKILNEQKMMKKLDKDLKRYNTTSSEYLVNFMGAYKFKEMFPANVYKNLSEYNFEDVTFMGPSKYDTYLKQLYGDYNVFPSLADRNKHGTKL